MRNANLGRETLAARATRKLRQAGDSATSPAPHDDHPEKVQSGDLFRTACNQRRCLVSNYPVRLKPALPRLYTASRRRTARWTNTRPHHSGGAAKARQYGALKREGRRVPIQLRRRPPQLISLVGTIRKLRRTCPFRMKLPRCASLPLYSRKPLHVLPYCDACCKLSHGAPDSTDFRFRERKETRHPKEWHPSQHGAALLSRSPLRYRKRATIHPSLREARGRMSVMMTIPLHCVNRRRAPSAWAWARRVALEVVATEEVDTVRVDTVGAATTEVA